ncbi:lipoate--protein ligase family protein [Carnobacterium pleistocenium]|uniref:lipoate--protein ligase family protein n=1 Tax=Carnobacterium pleistocenium TaxID=181073 RepID=UPI00054F15CC|nr:lipoate--protein ligase family protein [Carnobacterium pleistocenium]
MKINDNKSFLTDHSYELYQAETMPFANQTISHFALTDSLLRYAGKYQKNILHFWPISNLVILGMMDTKLPYFKDALDVIERYSYPYIVRNSGGLAVVGDEGVLNFSLILPENPKQKMTINAGYEYMLQLINDSLKSYGKTCLAYEIKDSYCPGDYDLSIDGKKFAGISQRRLKNGVAIMIYISVNGSQLKRAEMIRDFYQAGLKGETVKWHFPSIDPTVMATLEELLHISLTVAKMKNLIQATLLKNNCTIILGDYSPEILTDYNEGFEKMIRRNQQMLGTSIDKELMK